jgi:hypothetical protein
MKRPGSSAYVSVPHAADVKRSAKDTLRRPILVFALLVLCLGLSVSLLSSASARSEATLLATDPTATPTMVPCPTPSDPFSTANPC